MGPVDYIAITAIILIVGLAVFYIVRAKRRGEKCVGCPYSKQCGGNCGSCAHTQTNKNNDQKNN